MTKNEPPEPTSTKVQDPEGVGNPRSALSREAVVAFTVGEVARIGVGLGRVRLWLSGHSQELHDVDLAAFDAAIALVKDVHDQICESSQGVDVPVQHPEMEALIREAHAGRNVYEKLADLLGVPCDPGEVGWVYKLARRCVYKLEHAKLRKG